MILIQQMKPVLCLQVLKESFNIYNVIYSIVALQIKIMMYFKPIIIPSDKNHFVAGNKEHVSFKLALKAN